MARRWRSPPETFTPPSPITVSRPRDARASRDWQAAWFSTSRISASDGVRPHEEQVLADGPGEELGVLRDQAEALAQPVEVDDVLGMAVVEDPARLRVVQPGQELHQRRLARAGGADEGDRLAPAHGERHVARARARTRSGG